MTLIGWLRKDSIEMSVYYRMKKMSTVKLNMISAILMQFVTAISGLILPRLILSNFGSEVNGLVSSITQFLNYISLVEGGIGSVVLAALYRPLAEKNDETLNSVLNAANSFFRKIGMIFAIYCFFVGVVYPFVVNSRFSWNYIFVLTLILGSSLFIQYFFALTYRLLIQADQRIYLVNFVQIICSILNLALLCIEINIYPSIHLVKVLSSICYIIQPVVFGYYVNRNFNINKSIKPSEETLCQRWAGFGQNFAFFVHSNTDVVLLSLFADLKMVSVYSIYNMVLNSIKSFILSVSSVFSAMFGKSIAERDYKKALHDLAVYEYLAFTACTVVFGSCLYLLPSFVVLYTGGVEDVEYYMPVFSAVLTMAEFVYCVRDPYICIGYSAGKFKETALSSYIEAALNILISMILVNKYGLLGVAVGTLAGMAYRMLYQVFYLKNHIVKRKITYFRKRVLLCVVEIGISQFLISLLDTTGSGTVLLWVKNGCLCVVVYTAIVFAFSLFFDKEILKELWRKLKK